MKYLDLSFPSPEENLACDEALLDLSEQGSGGETLRFWESEKDFIVLGYSNKAGTEAHLDECHKYGAPVFRRPSGGGTVVQGKGCLNFSVILRIPDSGPLTNLTGTNHFIMERNREALAPLLTGKVEVQGTSDLTLNGLKFSGNAQRRKRHFLLFHGTFLYHFDLAKITKYLHLPSRQPDYRKSRAHENFVTNIPLTPEQIKQALKKEWKTDQHFANIPRQIMNELIQTQYSRGEWNFKF